MRKGKERKAKGRNKKKQRKGIRRRNEGKGKKGTKRAGGEMDIVRSDFLFF